MKNQICEWSKAIFSAHLHHFLPNIPWCNHDYIYEKFVGYHKPKKQPNIQIHDIANKETDYPFMHLLYSQLLVCQRVCLQNTVCLICK